MCLCFKKSKSILYKSDKSLNNSVSSIYLNYLIYHKSMSIIVYFSPLPTLHWYYSLLAFGWSTFFFSQLSFCFLILPNLRVCVSNGLLCYHSVAQCGVSNTSSVHLLKLPGEILNIFIFWKIFFVCLFTSDYK